MNVEYQIEKKNDDKLAFTFSTVLLALNLILLHPYF